MKNRILIGIHGIAQTGKTTAAQTLCRALELHRYTIARPVTEACAATLGLTHEQFLALPKKHPINILRITKREMMQQMGDFIIRNNPDALIHMLNARIQNNKQYNTFNNGDCIEDVRTESEAAWVRNQGGIVIHIIDNRKINIDQHRTERGIHFAQNTNDILIYNQGTKAELHDKLINIAHNIQTQLTGLLREA